MAADQSQSVLFLATCNGTAGTERMVISLSRLFKERGWKTRTLFPDGANSDRVIEWSRYFGVAAEKAPAFMHMDRGRSARDILTLAKMLRSSKSDIVNFHYGTSNASWRDAFAARLAGKRQVFTSIHGSRGLDPETEQTLVKSTRLAAKLSQAVVVVTQWSGDNLKSCGIPANKVRVVPCGLPIPQNVPSKQEARKKLDVPENAFLLATAGRMVPEKGISDFVQASARLADPDGCLRVLAAGVGDQKDEFEGQAKELLSSRARFLGHVDDVSLLYAAADVFVLATHAENCGLVYREAALQGVPVIGTAVGGNRETILDGRTGIIIPPQDIEALTQAMTRLKDDPALRQKMGREAKERAMVEFTEEAMAKRYEKVFQNTN